MDVLSADPLAGLSYHRHAANSQLQRKEQMSDERMLRSLDFRQFRK